MVSTKRLIPLAAMEKIMKKAGGDVRVSGKAKAAMKGILEEFAEKIASNAVRLANHAGRKTIKAEDIKLASKG